MRTPTPGVEGRLVGVFEVLADLERRSDALPSGSRRLHVSPERAWAADAEVAAIPTDRRAVGPADAPVEVLPTAAALVRLSKFSADGRIRVRAFYPEAGVTAKIVVGSRHRQGPVVRDAAARSEPGRWLHFDVPSLLESGRSRGYGYLVEELVSGRHPSAREERQYVAEALIGAVVDRRPSGPPLRLHVHWRTRARLAGLRATEAGVEIPVDRLMAMAGGMGRAPMPGGWCHGDLVPSNVVVDGGRLRVIDFEHAASMPVACDVAKIVAKAPEWSSLLVDLVARDPLGEGGPDTRTQLRWVYLRELSWARARERRAAAVGRLENHRSWLNRCLELIDALA